MLCLGSLLRPYSRLTQFRQLQCHCLITAKYSISSLLCTTLVRASVHCVTATLQDWPCHQAACSMRHPLAFQAGIVRSCSPQRCPQRSLSSFVRPPNLLRTLLFS
uniref:Uncharacterized protein n=1 Tax=Knipowitschia caucasica TaxID=637954 RepID=A0AAV2JVJ5_KNICA